jgi:hypothetical protein
MIASRVIATMRHDIDATALGPRLVQTHAKGFEVLYILRRHNDTAEPYGPVVEVQQRLALIVGRTRVQKPKSARGLCIDSPFPGLLRLINANGPSGSVEDFIVGTPERGS